MLSFGQADIQPASKPKLWCTFLL